MLKSGLRKFFSRKIVLIGIVGVAVAAAAAAGGLAWNRARTEKLQNRQLVTAVKLVKLLRSKDGAKSLSQQEKETFDVNRDGAVDQKDVNLLLRRNVGLK